MNSIVIVCIGLGLASALVGGVFLSFSDFVMRGMILAEAAAGMKSMQQLNRTVFRSVFLMTFFLLVPGTTVLAAYSWFKLDEYSRTLLTVGALVYVLLVFTVTAIGNVPMNEKLDRLSHLSSEGHDYWAVYSRIWTRWNHVRTLGSIVTSICLLLASVHLAATVANSS